MFFKTAINSFMAVNTINDDVKKLRSYLLGEIMSDFE